MKVSRCRMGHIYIYIGTCVCVCKHRLQKRRQNHTDKSRSAMAVNRRGGGADRKTVEGPLRLGATVYL